MRAFIKYNYASNNPNKVNMFIFWAAFLVFWTLFVKACEAPLKIFNTSLDRSGTAFVAQTSEARVCVCVCVNEDDVSPLEGDCMWYWFVFIPSLCSALAAEVVLQHSSHRERKDQTDSVWPGAVGPIGTDQLSPEVSVTGNEAVFTHCPRCLSLSLLLLGVGSPQLFVRHIWASPHG